MKQIILLGIVIVVLLLGIGYLMRRGNISLFPRVTLPSVTPTPNITTTPNITNTPTILPPIEDNLSINKNLVESLRNENDISHFYNAVLSTKLDGLLSTEDSYSVFAPNNAAMERINYTSYPKDKLNTVIKSHVSYGGADLNNNRSFLSVEGQQVSTNSVKIVKTIKASNGTIYIVDRLLTQ